ncbi:hypothetical protein M0R89_07290 [Halorussus limi]|uniref:Uncharacterized protein n=1 Tax=Halorussus limi TaxID=2938695 RepID=A0A8U0HY66_9EURY|nr:hypothetical protein [Halorussus limi]UPV75857.1 hypothetical protein M0R89_07290 [Halorussus limi]
MVDERESPSAGWREVYREMDADTGIEEATRSCPECARTCENVARDVYDCEEHGLFRASAEDDASETSASDSDRNDPASGGRDSRDADDSEETTTRTKWSAGPV